MLKQSDNRLNLKKPLCALVLLSVFAFLYIYASVYNSSRLWKSKAPGYANVNNIGGGDITELVNVFIGTTGGGHVFPGATLPHGMVKVGMDTDSPNNHAGYDADPRYRVTGFSQLHEDGTGGRAPLANFKLFPLPSCPIVPANSIHGNSDATGFVTRCPTSIQKRKITRKLKSSTSSSGSDTNGEKNASIKVDGNGFGLETGEGTGDDGSSLFGGMRADDAGSPGYFSTNLSSGVRVELTASRRTALHRYTFPPRPVSPNSEDDDDDDGAHVDWRPRIVVDITSDGDGTGSRAFASIDMEMGRVTGGARFRSSFGSGQYDAFVCVDFRESNALDVPLVPLEADVYARDRVFPGVKSFVGEVGEHGALFTFSPTPHPRDNHPHHIQTSPPNRAPPPGGADIGGTDTTSETIVILARVGVSLVSGAQACVNAETEIPEFEFDRVRENARARWAELLGRFEIEAREEQRDEAVLFYSSLYRSHIVPADYTGENPNWESSEPYYDSLYCNWDTYRTLFPLMALHDPITYARIVRAFVDVQQHEGWLPECRSATLQQFVQGGSSSDPILAEFFIKYGSQAKELGVAPEALYAALLADAEIEPEDWRFMGRQANAWKKYGYIPSGLHERGGIDTRQVSRTLEYAFDDFTISQVARELGYIKDWQTYQNRSRGWENLWNPATVLRDIADEEDVEGIRGFMQPKYAKNDSFGYTDPRQCTVHDPRHRSCYLDASNHDGFYEGGAIVYSQYVPHDTAELIELQGGKEAFIRRLDYIFDNGYFDSTNEPAQQMPFMYHYADRPGLSTERSREVIAQAFSTRVDGLPGNDDSGAMASFVVFHMLGLYPLPGTRELLVSSPFFKTVRIRNPLLGRTTTIRVNGFEESMKGKKIYVESIHINGDPWHSICYIIWDAFELGSAIDIVLTDDRTRACGKHESALPPSLSTGGYGTL